MQDLLLLGAVFAELLFGFYIIKKWDMLFDQLDTDEMPQDSFEIENSHTDFLEKSVENHQTE